MSGPLLQVRIRAGYRRHSVLRDVSFELHAGEILGLVGTSGAGKSTLVLALLGLLKWRDGHITGEILLDCKNLLSMRERELRTLRGKTIALVPQSPMTALNSALTLRAHFEEAWKAHEIPDERLWVCGSRR
jgi:ABC-type glutathione transport system ATPase component